MKGIRPQQIATVVKLSKSWALTTLPGFYPRPRLEGTDR